MVSLANELLILAAATVSGWGAYVTGRMALGAVTRREALAWGAITAVLGSLAARRALLLLTPWPYEAVPPPLNNIFILAIVAGALVFILQVEPAVRQFRAGASDLDAARQRFLRALDGAGDALAIVGEDGRYTYVNDAGCILFRYPREQVVGRHYREFFAETAAPSGATAAARTGRLDRTAVVRHIRCGDGTVLLIETDLISLGDGTLLFIGHDITERQRLVDDLEAEHQRLLLAQEISGAGSLELDLVTGERWWSPQLFRLWGFEPADAPPGEEAFRARIHPDDLAERDRTAALVTQGVGVGPSMFRIVLPTGEVRHLLSHTRIHRNQDGVPVRATRVQLDVTDQQAMHTDLERQYDRLLVAQEVSRTGSVEVNLLTRERWWSPELFRIWGFEPADTPPSLEEARARVHPDDHHIRDLTTDRVLEGSTFDPVTYRVLLPSGETRYILAHARVHHDAEGTPVRATRVEMDVTPLSTLQLQLDLERERLLLAQAIGRVGSEEIDLRTGAIWWSPETYRLFGLEPSGTPPSQDESRRLIHPDDRALTARSTDLLLGGVAHETLVHRIVTPAGETRTLQMHVRVDRDAAGVPVRATRVSIDITELRQLEEERDQERARLLIAQEVGHVGSVDVDLRTGKRSWSAEMYRLLGLPASAPEPTRDQILAMAHPDDRERLHEALTAASEGRLPAGGVEVLHRMILGNGETRLLRAQISGTVASDGTPLTFSVVSTDLTEVLGLQARLAQAERLRGLGTLAGGVAHDFNNLLTIIGGNIELASMGDTARLSLAQQGVRRATDLVRQLLRIARPGTETASPPRDAVDLAGIAAHAASAAAGTFQGVTLRHSLPDAPALVRADATDLDRLLMNLLVNARDAVRERVAAEGMDYRGEVRLVVVARDETPQSAGYVQLDVIDNGAGMSEETREHLFEPFYTTKRGGQGTGLGLATVYAVIEEIGGTIDVQSERGRGTTFRIRLPLAQPDGAATAPLPAPVSQPGSQPAAQSPVQSPAQSPAQSIPEPAQAPATASVLVVDDEPDVRTFVGDTLRRAGITAELVGTAEAAIHALQARRYDLAVLDIQLGTDRTGWDVLRDVRGSHPEQRVLICSSSSTVDEARRHGAVGLLPKPFDGATLVEIVRTAMRADRGPLESAALFRDPLPPRER